MILHYYDTSVGHFGHFGKKQIQNLFIKVTWLYIGATYGEGKGGIPPFPPISGAYVVIVNNSLPSCLKTFHESNAIQCIQIVDPFETGSTPSCDRIFERAKICMQYRENISLRFSNNYDYMTVYNLSAKYLVSKEVQEPQQKASVGK